MVIPHQADGRGVTDLADNLDARARFADAETVARQNLPIALRMELSEALGELELATVDGQGPIGALLPFHRIRRQAVGVDAQEIADTCPLEAQEARHPVETHHMDDILLHRAENPLEHVVEMHTDIGGNTAALVDIPLPGSVIPLTAGGNVREVHIVHLVRRALVYLFLKGDDGIVKTKLKDVIGLVAGFLLHLLQGVDVVRIQDNRLLTDDIAAQAQSVADERVVRVVGRTDAHPVQRLVRLLLLGAVTVKKLVLREEGTLRDKTVQTADTIELVVGGQKIVAGVPDRLNMTGGDVTRRPD